MRENHSNYFTRVFYPEYICDSQSHFQTLIGYMCLNITWYCILNFKFEIFMTICKHFQSGNPGDVFILRILVAFSVARVHNIMNVPHWLSPQDFSVPASPCIEQKLDIRAVILCGTVLYVSFWNLLGK